MGETAKYCHSQISHMYRHAQMASYIDNNMYVDPNISQRYVCLIYLGQADISWLPSYQENNNENLLSIYCIMMGRERTDGYRVRHNHLFGRLALLVGNIEKGKRDQT